MNSIIVLGGSYLQSEFISNAVEKKYDVHVIDANKDCHCSTYNITFHNFSFTDYDRVLNLVNKIKAVSIISPSNEKGNLIAARISKNKDILYNSIETVNLTIDKHLMRKHLSLDLEFKQAKTFQKDEQLTYPVIVKPSSSSASRGISMAFSESELENSVLLASKYTDSKDEILIEEFIQGKQYSLETITKNGNHYLVGITEEYISGPPFFLERCHFTGPTVWDSYYSKFNNYIIRLLKHFDIKVGPSHIEILLQNDNIYLIEIASRSGGWRDKLLKYSEGSDLNNLILQSYTLDEIETKLIKRPKYNSMVGIKIKSSDQRIEKQAQNDQVLVEIYNNGSTINNKPTNLIDAVGYFYLASSKSLINYKLS